VTQPWEPPEDDAERIAGAWRRQGARITPQRRELLDVLLAGHGHLTALEVAGLLRDDGTGVDVSTVHRSLTDLHRIGLVYRVAVKGPRGQVSHAYRLVGPTEYTAFCTVCQEVAPLPTPVALRAARSLVRASGFELSTEAPAFSGTCPACRDGQGPTG
jgi:Fe2+ or Zn2+ uptake regulation protein